MSSTQPAFGGMFRQLIELGVIEINTEPLDDRIERRLKQFWENTSCPRCGHQSIMTWEHSSLVKSEIAVQRRDQLAEGSLLFA